MSQKSQSSRISTWLAGIAATVIGAVVIWWLTHEGGLLNPMRPTPTPIARPQIIDFQVTGTTVGGSAKANLSVYNDGDTAAEDCQVWWYSGSDVGKELEKRLLPSTSAVSRKFGLRPKESYQVEMSSLIYKEVGRFMSIAEVLCLGVNVKSQQIERDVTVRP